MLKDPHFKESYELGQQKMVVVKKIIEYRIKHNLTQAQLAKKLKVSQQHISKIENAEFSNIATLEKVLFGIGYRVKIDIIPLSAKTKNRSKKVLGKV